MYFKWLLLYDWYTFYVSRNRLRIVPIANWFLEREENKVSWNLIRVHRCLTLRFRFHNDIGMFRDIRNQSTRYSFRAIICGIDSVTDSRSPSSSHSKTELFHEPPLYERVSRAEDCTRVDIKPISNYVQCWNRNGRVTARTVRAENRSTRRTPYVT